MKRPGTAPGFGLTTRRDTRKEQPIAAAFSVGWKDTAEAGMAGKQMLYH